MNYSIYIKEYYICWRTDMELERTRNGWFNNNS